MTLMDNLFFYVLPWTGLVLAIIWHFSSKNKKQGGKEE
jgi:hypothetical protein